jgi:hypothetical protein
MVVRLCQASAWLAWLADPIANAAVTVMNESPSKRFGTD